MTSTSTCRRTGCSPDMFEARIGRLDILRALVESQRRVIHHSSSCNCPCCGYFEIGILHFHRNHHLCSGATALQATDLRTTRARVPSCGPLKESDKPHWGCHCAMKTAPCKEEEGGLRNRVRRSLKQDWEVVVYRTGLRLCRSSVAGLCLRSTRRADRALRKPRGRISS